MNRDLISEKIKGILDLPSIKGSDKLLEYMDDSLSVFESIMYIEDAFNINIPIDNSIVTFDDLLNIVERVINGKKTSIV